MPWPGLVIAGIAFTFLVLPLAGLLGQVPWSTLGTDLSTREATAVISAYILWEARKLGIPAGVLLRMIGNVGLDWAVGSIPVQGTPAA